MPGLGDSKALSVARRREVAAILKRELAAWGLGWAWPGEIDRLNIHYATLLAMQRAYAEATAACSEELLGAIAEPVLIDGKFIPELPVAASAVVGGDATIPAVQAASILAKTARDAWMIEYAAREPQYLFEKHKGYPTPEHKALIRTYGPSRIHRHSFKASL